MSTQILDQGHMPDSPRIAVVGSGAMGCYFGGFLSKAGQNVIFIDVNPDTITTINQQGIILETDSGVERIAAKAVFAEEIGSSVDLVILFTKTIHTEAAIASIRHLVTPNTIVLSLQNGLGNAERLSKVFALDRVVLGTTLVPADLHSMGHVISHGPSSSLIMDAKLKHPTWLTQLSELLNNASLSTQIEPAIYEAIWAKVAFNAALNSICTILGRPPGFLSQDLNSMNLARQVVHETVTIGSANGIRMDESEIWKKVEMAIHEHPNHKPSMLQDVEAGRLTEISAINGAIVEAAQRCSLDAPINFTLTQLVKSKEIIASQNV